MKLIEQARSGKPKNMDSKAMLQAIEANLMSNTQKISGKVSITQSSMAHQLHEYGGLIQSC